MASMDFEDGSDGACPDHWTCDVVGKTRLSNSNYNTPSGDFMFIIAQECSGVVIGAQ